MFRGVNRVVKRHEYVNRVAGYLERDDEIAFLHIPARIVRGDFPIFEIGFEDGVAVDLGENELVYFETRVLLQAPHHVTPTIPCREGACGVYMGWVFDRGCSEVCVRCLYGCIYM